jgi:hypothetical protein
VSKEKARARRLWVMFRLTPAQAGKIEQFQRDHTVYKVLLGNRNVIDHRHSDGLVRGKLDWLINKGYGILEKAAPNNLGEVLLALAIYHDKPPAVEALGGPVHGLTGLAKYKRKMIYGGVAECTKQPKKKVVRLKK